MIENQRMSSFGSNESQEGLDPPSNKLQNKLAIDSWSLRISQKISKHAVNLIRFCFCISLGIVLASNISAKQYSQLSNGIMASNEILLNKGLRGVFPPLQGSEDQLLGRWSLTVMTQPRSTSNRFNKYSLNFKSNGEIEITKQKCKGDIRMKWYTFYYNISFKLKPDPQNFQMEIPNEKEDIDCITDNGEFIKILYNSSIWTVVLKNLYIVSQQNTNGSSNTKMLIFRKN